MQQTLNAVDLFAEFQRDGFRLPEHPQIIADLEGQVAAGDCLEPIITAGDILFIEYGATPQHGDLVLFEWSQEVQKSWATDPRRTEWISKFGNANFSRGVKLFWRWPQGIPEQYQDDYLLTNEDMREAKDHKILGVVREVARCGHIAHGDLVHRPFPLASIDPNAATSTLTSSLSGNAGSFTSPTTNGSITVGPFYFATTVILTVTGQWNFTFSGATVTGMVLRYGISTSGSFTGALVTVDTSTQANSGTPGLGPLTQEISVSLAAGTTTTYNMLSGLNPSGVIGTNIAIGGIIKAEVIKR